MLCPLRTKAEMLPHYCKALNMLVLPITSFNAKTKTPAKLAPLRRPVKVRRLRRFPQKMTPYGRNFFRKNLDRTPPRGREGSPFSFFSFFTVFSFLSFFRLRSVRH